MTQYITLTKQAKDITGQTFGRLTALGPIGRDKRKTILWLCQCICGGTKICPVANLFNGNTLSCGCIHREQLAERNRTHGMRNDPLYSIWAGILKRCTNANSRSYLHYGGRGISVCEEWQHDFQAFHTHVSQLPHCGEAGYSIDRIDNDGNYEPGNVRWSTASQQTRNQRRNRLYTYNGKSQCLAEWAEEYAIDYGRLKGRIKLGWTMEDALNNPNGVRRAGKNRPVYPYGERHQHAKLTDADVINIRKRHTQGETCTHIAAEYGMSRGAIAKIIKRETWTHLS